MDHADGNFVGFLLSSRGTTLSVIAASLTLVGLILLIADAPAMVSILSFAVAILIGGLPVAWHAYQEVRLAHSLGINSLMVIAS